MLAAGAAVSPVPALAVAVPTPERPTRPSFWARAATCFRGAYPISLPGARSRHGDRYFRIFRREGRLGAGQPQKKDGYKIALVVIRWETPRSPISRDIWRSTCCWRFPNPRSGQNHRIKKENTRRSVLWYGPDFLSNAGLGRRLRYSQLRQRVPPVDECGSPRGQWRARELQDLVLWEEMTDWPWPRVRSPRNDAARQADGATTGAAPASAQSVSDGWQPLRRPNSRDVTCMECWGFKSASLGAQGLDPWTR